MNWVASKVVSSVSLNHAVGKRVQITAQKERSSSRSRTGTQEAIVLALPAFLPEVFLSTLWAEAINLGFAAPALLQMRLTTPSPVARLFRPAVASAMGGFYIPDYPKAVGAPRKSKLI